MKRGIIICTTIVAALLIVATIVVVTVTRQSAIDVKEQACADSYPAGSADYFYCMDRADD